MQIFQTFAGKFAEHFIEDNRWRFIVNGLGNTLLITVFALLIGLLLGFLVAYIRVTHHNTGRMRWPDRICRAYLSIIRGTPALIQLMITYYIIFAGVPGVPKVAVAIVAFGINSGAYVSEIFRGGIMSVDSGQMEAGRSLGLSYPQTMTRVIMPQAFKNALPSLCNEFITLLKETSVAGYIGVQDLTKGGDIIRSLTYEPYFPLICVAIIYWIVVHFLEIGVNRLERRLRQSDRS